eukprot:CAMPEP_0170143364 /NCGR_PEP_ID=MMETSP0033_2-20121228/10528_1 /TAXON_ID=195969 /ORGANISM="Dolichomastix tenuilepis, Strain CCMP3274" /LENGTH=245 /DNA_ID=CAMNT_0010379811 /DNA_START=18 /DNA_END=755 /DNA_ORIENTATION=+
MTTIKTLAVLIAMDAEAKPLVEHLSLERIEPSPIPGPLPCVCYGGEAHGVKVYVVTNGSCPNHKVDCVGTVPAALTAYAVCSQLKPDLLLNAGTAGGFKRAGGAVGDVYISTGFRNHDRRISIPGFDMYGHGHLDALPVPNTLAALGFKSGLVSSGNSLDLCDADAKIMDSHEASVKEMEAAGIAFVADLHSMPFVALKAITDIVDGDKPSHEEFMQNLGTAAQALQAAVPKFIAHVAGKAVSDL